MAELKQLFYEQRFIVSSLRIRQVVVTHTPLLLSLYAPARSVLAAL